MWERKTKYFIEFFLLIICLTIVSSASGNWDRSSVGWKWLSDYPVSCPSGAITELGDSVVCTDSWVDAAGDTMTGKLTVSAESNITGEGVINSTKINSSGVTLTNKTTAYDTHLTHTGVKFNGIVQEHSPYVVCRGTSVLDDFWKSTWWSGCDSVCKHNDADCGDDVNTALLSKGKIVIIEGRYPLTNILPKIYSNTEISGVGNVTFNVSISTAFSAGVADLENVIIRNLNFQADTLSNKDIIINFTNLNSADNIIIENIGVNNWNGTAIDIRLTNVTSQRIQNVFISGIRLHDVLSGIIMRENLEERRDKLKNINIRNIYHDTPNQQANFQKYIGYTINIIGAKVLDIENIQAINQTQDGPVIQLYRSENIKVENVYTYYQRDYAVDLIDGCRNAYVNNIVVENPQYWGVLLIHNDNINDSTRDIFAQNLYCFDCDTGLNSYQPIYINANKVGMEIMERITIQNFYVNNTQAYGGIEVNANKGNIKDITIRDGIIENVNQAGIYFRGSNNTDNVLIENVRVIDPARSTADNDKKACFNFYNSNVTNVRLHRNTCWNKSGGTFYGVRVLASGDPKQFFGEFINNNFIDFTPATHYSFYGGNVDGYYIDDYKYSSAPTECSSTNPQIQELFEGRTITNGTGRTSRCTCIFGKWQCIETNQTYVYYSPNSRVGIGTTTPGAKLEVQSNGLDSLLLDTDSDHVSLKIDSEATTDNAIEISSANSGSAGAGNSNSYAFFVNNVGDGGSLYAYRDDASSTHEVAHIKQDNSGSTGEALVLDQDGNAIGLSIDSEATTLTSPSVNIADAVNNRSIAIEDFDRICLDGTGCAKWLMYNTTAGCITSSNGGCI